MSSVAGTVRVVAPERRREPLVAAVGEHVAGASVAGADDVAAAGADDPAVLVLGALHDADPAAVLARAAEAVPGANLVVAPTSGDDAIARAAASHGARYVPTGEDPGAALGAAVGSALGDDRLATLQDVVDDLEAAGDAEAVSRVVVDAAVAMTGAAGAVMGVLRDGVVEPLAASDERFAAETRPFAPGEGWLGGTAISGETLVVDDAQSEPDVDPRLGTRAVVTVGRAGTCSLQVAATSPGAFDDADVQALELLASAANAALNALDAETSLRERRADFETLFEAVPEPLVNAHIDADDEPIIERVNEAFVETFGYDREAVVGASLDEFVVPEGRDAEAKDITASIRRGEPVQREAPRLTADGERMFRIRVESLAGGEDAAALAMYVDVTERRNREALLAELTDATAAIGAAGSAVEVCEAVAATADRLVGPQHYSCLLEEDGVLVPTVTSENLRAEWARPRSTSEGVTGRVHRTGTAMLVDDVESHPVAQATGPYLSGLVVPLGGHGTFAMVSEERAAFDAADLEVAQVLAAHAGDALDRIEREDAVETERERFDALAESIPEPVARVRLAVEGPLVRSVNSAFVDTFGYDESTMVGRDLNEFVVPRSDRERAEDLDEQLRANERVETELRRRTADGDRTFRVHAVPLAREGVDEAVVVYVDVTDQRRRIEFMERRLDRVTCLLDGLDDGAEDRLDALATVAGAGDPVEDPDRVALGEAVADAWRAVGGAERDLAVVDALPTVDGDADRVRELFERLLDARRDAGDELSVTVGTTTDPEGARPAGEGADPARPFGVYVADDGPPPADAMLADPPSGVAEGSYAVAAARTLAAAHGWRLRVVEGEAGGARFELRGF
jgi:PAS domain S-box-containing protein